VIYLGHIITKDGIRPDPSKLYAVEKFSMPRKIKGVQSFLGLAGYYQKFIEDFSKIAKPLTKLLEEVEGTITPSVTVLSKLYQLALSCSV